MRRLDLTSLRLFIAVCETRSVSRVADSESIVVSAVSKRLAQLEHLVGAKLLHRSKAGVSLTPAGETLLQHAYQVLAKVDALEQDMSRYSRTVHGHVRLLAAETVITEFLPSHLARFMRITAHQRIDVKLEEHLSHEEVAFAVRQGLAPLGICWDVVDLEGLQTVPYRTDCLGIVVHRDHALAGRGEIDFRHTLDYEHIGKRPSTIFPAALADCVEIVGRAVRYRAVVSSFDAAIRLAHSGLGIALVPREAAKSFSRFEEICFVPLSNAWAIRRFVLCAHDFSRLPPAACMLANYLTQQSRAMAEQTTDHMERTFA